MTYSEYMKSSKERDEKFFFGESVRHVSNKYITFNHVIDDDTIIINTNNLKTIKGNFVLIVDNDKGVYLKDWQVRPMHNYDLGLDLFCVKLSRKYFKPYTFKFSFDEFSFEKEMTFDDLKEIAASQNELKLANGFLN